MPERHVCYRIGKNCGINEKLSDGEETGQSINGFQYLENHAWCIDINRYCTS